MQTDSDPLSRRERELMDIVYRLGHATVAQVREGMAQPPSYSAVRALLRTLETKGHLVHHQEGRAYIYAPVHSAREAGSQALRRIVSAFFGGSAVRAAMALVTLEDIDPAELVELQEAIHRAEGSEE